MRRLHVPGARPGKPPIAIHLLTCVGAALATAAVALPCQLGRIAAWPQPPWLLRGAGCSWID